MSIDFAKYESIAQVGLLEQPVLLLAPSDSTGRLWLEDSFGERVGFAIREPKLWRPAWWPATLAVHEAFEEPIVFRTQRQWTIWPRWLVLDSENEVIGTVGGMYLWDRWERVVFRRVGRRAFVTADGMPAAEWTHEGNRIRLVLHAAVQAEPFAKMLLLSAVLVSG